MPILKQTQSPFGAALGFHVAGRAEIDIQGVHQVAMVTVSSWPAESDYIANEGRGAAWNWHVGLPLAALAGATFATSVEAALLTDENSPFVGGSIIPFASGLDVARQRQWARIKQTRNVLEQGGFVWDGSTFDSDMLSSARWQATVGSAARAVAASDATWATPWKLADNTFRVLTASNVAAIDDTRFAYMRSLHIISNTLYEQISDPAKATVAEVEAVVWPA